MRGSIARLASLRCIAAVCVSRGLRGGRGRLLLCRPAMSAARGSNVVSVSGSPAFISTLAGGGNEIEPRQSFYSTMITCNGGVAYSPDCSRIYVGFSHASNPQIRFLDLESQMVDVLCGLPAPPQAMACNRLGYLFVAASNKIHRVDFNSGEVSFIAGGGPGGNDASGESAGFSEIRALVVDGNDDLLVVDANCIRKVALQRGEVVTVCGSREAGHVDGVGGSARFNCPHGICTAYASMRTIISTWPTETTTGSARCDPEMRGGDGKRLPLLATVSLVWWMPRGLPPQCAVLPMSCASTAGSMLSSLTQSAACPQHIT